MFVLSVGVKAYFYMLWGGCVGGGEMATTDIKLLFRAQDTCYRTNPGTEAEPQQIVAQRLLSCLQYHVP